MAAAVKHALDDMKGVPTVHRMVCTEAAVASFSRGSNVPSADSAAER
jgi:hypothetical protein